MAGKRGKIPAFLRYISFPLETKKMLGFPAHIAMLISFFPPQKKTKKTKRDVVINHSTNTTLQWFNTPSTFHQSQASTVAGGSSQGLDTLKEANWNRFGQLRIVGSMWLGVGWTQPTTTLLHQFTSPGFFGCGKRFGSQPPPFLERFFFWKFRGIGRGPEVHD